MSVTRSARADSVPIEITSRLLFGALSSAATEIAGSADPEEVGVQVESVIVQLLTRVRKSP